VRFSRSAATVLFSCAALAQETFLVPMRDGVRLATDVYGAEAGVRKPVLLLRTPYDKKGGSATARRYAAAGYVAAVQDARGAFASEGQYFHHNNDDQDGFDTIEWLARQPWSNGKTSTWGGSHPGAVQWLAAGERPYGLTAMAPTAASASLYYTAYVGGALRLALIGGAGPAITKPPAGMTAPADLTPFYAKLPVAELDKAIGWDMPWLRGMITHPWLDGFWTRQHASERVKGLDLPVQHIVGYYDFLCKETVASFQRMRKHSLTEWARTNQQLILGPWDHGTVGKSVVAGFDFGATAKVDVVEENLRWFDRFMKDGGPGEFPRVRYFVLGRQEWRTAPDWPPPGTVETSLYLQPERRLTPMRAALDGIDSFISDPANPVPVEPPGSEPMPRSSMFRPVDRRTIEERQDVIAYTAPPQSKELVVAGNPRAELWVGVDAKDADYTVKFVDVWPNGAAYPVAEGVLRLTHRDGDKEPSAVVPGSVYRITVDLGHTAFALLPGHALRVEIAGSYFPAYDPNTHTGEGPFARTAQVATQYIHRGPVRASRVLIPVLR
jgi:putative CocE/NonD family hydrolase